MTTATCSRSVGLCFLLLALFSNASFGTDWLFKRSRYTHDPHSHDRVTQYSPIGPFYANDLPNYQKSGFHYSRSSLQVGPSADHLHVVETWGRPVEPYGQWRYPYRPYSAPYQAWGPPYGGLGNVGVGLLGPYGYGPAYNYGSAYGYAPANGAAPGYGAGFGANGFTPGYAPGFGGGYAPQPNWTNPFGGPPGVDEYYPDAPSPSRLSPYYGF